MFLKRSKENDAVAEGQIYRRYRPGQTETARVISIRPDEAGIPHVRYALQFDRPDTTEELRTLALTSFSQLFPERVPA
ncbi:hypothetical protein [Arenibaculum pallidiluteum]|uniref:hypothetical protein n=1 Tax=Arenibaculum pallidiluteum TaxID=2812559 RepID=UPI001A976D56|nr:hypothetical protein [Arenibaculum pallidiluteum]